MKLKSLMKETFPSAAGTKRLQLPDPLRPLHDPLYRILKAYINTENIHEGV